ncbi:Alcohol acetyltransferase [Fusarium equiseti]|uniref:Alcohol acetyltransferase n=1 Tax=Fusarium equiseti TaxID=61235 RepID=A0ABQ8QZB3_FUSEQ|nr:Alcohol acetyltransferase [Fusarium equiseti]
MAEHNLPTIRPLGKLEELAAAAHHIGFFTNCGFSAHYRPSQPSPELDLESLVLQAVSQVLPQYPILFAIPVLPDNEKPYWGRIESIDLKQVVSFVQRTQPLSSSSQTDDELDSLLEERHNTSFKIGYGTLPVWRLIILQDYDSQDGFTACFIYHHSSCDGTSAQIFQDAFQKALCDASLDVGNTKAERFIFSNDDPISSPLEDLHPLPLPETPAQSDAAGVEEWRGSPVTIPCKTRYKSLSFPVHVLQSFAQECKKNKTTVTAALPALVARLLYDSLPSTTEALTCNLPVSLRSDLPPKKVDGVMGNFIDAFKVQLLRSDLDQNLTPWKHAKKVQQATRRYFANTSPSGEPYANVAVFKLIPDIKTILASSVGNPRGESFEVSNLGTFPQPKNLKGNGSPFWERGRLQLSRCVYAPGAPLVVCVIDNEEYVGFGFTWQADVGDDEVAGNVIDKLRNYFTQ